MKLLNNHLQNLKHLKNKIITPNYKKILEQNNFTNEIIQKLNKIFKKRN